MRASCLGYCYLLLGQQVLGIWYYVHWILLGYCYPLPGTGAFLVLLLPVLSYKAGLLGAQVRAAEPGPLACLDRALRLFTGCLGAVALWGCERLLCFCELEPSKGHNRGCLRGKTKCVSLEHGLHCAGLCREVPAYMRLLERAREKGIEPQASRS